MPASRMNSTTARSSRELAASCCFSVLLASWAASIAGMRYQVETIQISTPNPARNAMVAQRMRPEQRQGGRGCATGDTGGLYGVSSNMGTAGSANLPLPRYRLAAVPSVAYAERVPVGLRLARLLCAPDPGALSARR